MTFVKFYFFAGIALLLWLTWANFNGLNLMENLIPDVRSGRYSTSGVFHK